MLVAKVASSAERGHSAISTSRAAQATSPSASRKAGGARDRRSRVLDINADMLEVGRARAQKKGLAGKLTFVEANAEELPFPGQCIRRLYDRLRHPQRAAHRAGARRALSAC